jgi:hypothetical protein
MQVDQLPVNAINRQATDGKNYSTVSIIQHNTILVPPVLAVFPQQHSKLRTSLYHFNEKIFVPSIHKD